MQEGIFISFEGGDGCGKSTQIKLFTEYLQSKGYDVVVTREPGGTSISEKIRTILLDPENKGMSSRAEALLYSAARAQLVDELIRPSIKAGKAVISDRFLDSSIAYQGFARGLGDGVLKINEFAVSEVMPNLTFYLNLSPQSGMQRVEKNRHSKDRIELESMDFHYSVHQGYLKLAEMYPERIVSIDATMKIKAVAEEIRKVFDEYVAKRSI